MDTSLLPSSKRGMPCQMYRATSWLISGVKRLLQQCSQESKSCQYLWQSRVATKMLKYRKQWWTHSTDLKHWNISAKLLSSNMHCENHCTSLNWISKNCCWAHKIAFLHLLFHQMLRVGFFWTLKRIKWVSEKPCRWCRCDSAVRRKAFTPVYNHPVWESHTLRGCVFCRTNCVIM